MSEVYIKIKSAHVCVSKVVFCDHVHVLDFTPQVRVLLGQIYFISEYLSELVTITQHLGSYFSMTSVAVEWTPLKMSVVKSQGES